MKKCYQYPDKKRYNTQKDAETALLLINNESLRFYKCDACQGWHLTSSPQLFF